MTIKRNGLIFELNFINWVEKMIAYIKRSILQVTLTDIRLNKSKKGNETKKREGQKFVKSKLMYTLFSLAYR